MEVRAFRIRAALMLVEAPFSDRLS